MCTHSNIPVHGLSVHRWIPVGIVEDDSVCSREVDANTSSSSGGDEQKDPRVCVELIHEPLAVLHLQKKSNNEWKQMPQLPFLLYRAQRELTTVHMRQHVDIRQKRCVSCEMERKYLCRTV